MSKRPDFTIAQVIEQFEVSRSTVRRGLNDGRFPHAKKDHHGRWLIPVDDILQAGFPPRKTWLNEPTHEPGSSVDNEPLRPAQNNSDQNDNAGFMNQVHLEKELAHERAQVDKLKALLEAERAHVESLRMALRMIETGASDNSFRRDTATSDPTPKQARSVQPPVPEKPSLFQRLFKRH